MDLYAPGTLIRSSIPNNAFSNFNGTSMAAPHVAGSFAVFRQAKSDATVNELEGILKSVGPVVTSSGIGRRRLDVVNVLKALGVSVSPVVGPMLNILIE